MSMFKFQNYSAIKNAQDNPRIIATAPTKNGYAFGVSDNAGLEKQTAFSDANTAKAEDVYVAMNIIDKPETLNTNDYQIEVGEYIRGFNLNKMLGEKVEFTSDLVIDAYGDVSVGDILIPANVTDNASSPMKWVKTATPSGYGVVIEVTRKTTFGAFTIDGGIGAGFEGKLKSK